MILLDTNILSELMKSAPDRAVVGWLDAQVAADVFYSAVSRAEIQLGIALLPEGKRKQQLDVAAAAMFAQLSGRCLSFGELAAHRYADVVAERMRMGRPITVEDAQIAAIALTHGLRLATRNVKDFTEISGLHVINPWQLGAD